MRSIAMSVSVCLFVPARITQKPHHRTSPNFLCMLPVAVFRSFSDSAAFQPCYIRTAKKFLVGLRAHNKFGDQRFAVAGPRLWNSLPTSLRKITSYGQFRRYI